MRDRFIHTLCQLAASDPRIMLITKLITAKTRNTNSNVLPISIDTPAKPVAPNKNATSAITKNVIAAFNIRSPCFFGLLLIKLTRKLAFLSFLKQCKGLLPNSSWCYQIK